MNAPENRLADSPARIGFDPASGPDLSAYSVRLLLTDPLPDGDVAILYQVCSERAAQIHRRGHSPQADAELPVTLLPRRARRYLDDAIEYLSLNRVDVAVPKLLKAAALIIASIARIRMENSEPQP